MCLVVKISRVDQSVKLVGYCVNAALNVQGRETSNESSIGKLVEDTLIESSGQTVLETRL